MEPSKPSTSKYCNDVLYDIFKHVDKFTDLKELRNVSSRFKRLTAPQHHVALDIFACHDGIEVETKINKASAVRKNKAETLDWSRRAYRPVDSFGCRKMTLCCEYKDREFASGFQQIGPLIEEHDGELFDRLKELRLYLDSDYTHCSVSSSLKIDPYITEIIHHLRPNMKKLEFYALPKRNYMLAFDHLFGLFPRELHVAAKEDHFREVVKKCTESTKTHIALYMDQFGKPDKCDFVTLFDELAKAWSTSKTIHKNYVHIEYETTPSENHQIIKTAYKENSTRWTKPLTICPLLQTQMFIDHKSLTFYVAPIIYIIRKSYNGHLRIIAKERCAIHVYHNDEAGSDNIRQMMFEGEVVATPPNYITSKILVCRVPDELVPFFSLKFFDGPAASGRKATVLSEFMSSPNGPLCPIKIETIRRRRADTVDEGCSPPKAKKSKLEITESVEPDKVLA